MSRLIGEEKRHSLLRLAGKKSSAILFTLLPVIFCCAVAYAQNVPQAQSPSSELARQNMDRVAASAAQIEAVLHKDTGLMVELKAWVAKDATDHGQLISDSDLTDQAIFDRLDTDVEFRSVATRILQKYGYLLPKVNPDSPQGKEQQLVVQERAKWIAQDEEEQLRQAKQQGEQSMLQTRSCDPQLDPNCPVQQSVYPAGQQSEGTGVPGIRPGNLPPNVQAPQVAPRRSLPTLEQTQLVPPGAGLPTSNQELPELQGSSYGALASLGAGIAGPGTLVPTNIPSDITGQGPQNPALPEGGLQNQLSLGGSIRGNAGAYSQGASAASAGPVPESGGAVGSEGLSSTAYEPTPYSSVPSYSRRTNDSATLSQRMVRQVNPFTDVPSLYDMYLQASPQPPTPERFGLQVFEYGARSSQTIPFDLPVGPDYVVGPGDSLAIDLWGGVSQRLLRTVDPEGRISLPEAGPLLVAGKSLADVQASVQKTLRTQFRDVSADVSLARLRTIRVYVVGDVEHPGAYDISSLSTPLNALFAAGGPTSQGSLRILDHNRGNQTVQAVDVYDLLLKGVKTDIERLENGDTVLVPPIGPQVTVEGMVRRPAIYELRDEKTLSDVLALAGGLLPTATLRHIEVQRVVAHEKRTMLSLDISQDDNSAQITQQLDSFQVQDGDRIRIFPIAPYNSDTVYLEGHVLRPGKYSYHDGMRVTDLVSSYKELLPEPASQYAEIIRLNAPDYHPTVESFNLADALAHPATAPVLEPLDTVQVFGRYDFENPPTVSVWGDVRVPGTYRTSGQIHLSDAIHMAGGLAPDAETDDAQVFRYLPNGELNIFSVKLSEAIAGNPEDNILLNSRDRILVHRNPADVDPATVYIKGEVARPGRYPLTTNMTVADLIRAAGGAKQSADLKSADLTHYEWNGKLQMTGQHEEIELASAMAGSKDTNVSLHNGDVLTMRELPGWDDLGASIRIRGEVRHPGSYGIRPGESLSSVLLRAGGFQPDAYPYGAVLVRDEVQRLEDKSHTELVERVREQQASLQLAAVRANDPDEKLADQAAYQQWQNTVDGLMNNPPLGRVMIQISPNIKGWENSPRDIAVRAGDKLVIPKRPSFVMVQGQVFNPTAVAFRPGKSAKWYLSQAGGPTNLANKKAIFVIRADGSVVGSRGSSWFLGGALSESLQPGDTVVVPEKALGGPPTWKALFQAIQVGSAITTSAILAAKY